jgi:hypothetical protein
MGGKTVNRQPIKAGKFKINEGRMMILNVLMEAAGVGLPPFAFITHNTIPP